MRAALAWLGLRQTSLHPLGALDDQAFVLQDAGIVRHRGKIEAVINNARRAQAIVAETGSLAAFIWRYEPTADAAAAPETPKRKISAKDLDAMKSLVSTEYSPWSNEFLVSQDVINDFAKLSGDDYWIHTDPARARSLATWFDRANRTRDLLRTTVRADLAMVELLLAWAGSDRGRAVGARRG